MQSSFISLSDVELFNRIGCRNQLSYAKKMSFAEGPAKGLEFVEVQNGTGLFCQVLSDRGMGLGRVTIKGIPACWISPNEEIAPWYYNPSGFSWLQSFGGGMLTSCGLLNTGNPTEVEGIPIGLHGRLSHIPARNVYVHRDEKTGSLFVEGDVIDCNVLGPMFSLHRSYEFPFEENRIILHDRITNLSDVEQPFFLLYHMNFGYPFLSETAQLSIDDRLGEVVSKEKEYADERFQWNEFHKPVRGMKERVFFHNLFEKEKNSRIVLSNEYEDCLLRAIISFPLNEMNHLVEWKMLGNNTYVLGLEPGTSFVAGRDVSIEQQDYARLAPLASKDFHLCLFFDVKYKNV